ncbi:DMT family transporter [Oceanivirga miroungae]|uniref:DMT family transporter n=1 Tax=Oceanivirga miroungae TaxID=1130046 RepID=A0A6I8M577_9FUSO|nr:DMT family transporter [Oceanivirga miroungae]VWL85078.1 hypothetical protein OMES3154_00360 [Oceanivirga miroungae]
MIESKFIYILLVIVAGVSVTFQNSINGALASKTSTVFSVFWVFLIGTLIIIPYLFISKTPFPTIQNLKEIPFHYYLGAITGLIYVALVMISIPKLGVAYTTALLIVSQIVISLVIDRFGLLGAEVKYITIDKIMGSILMIIGVYYIGK